MPTQHLRRVKLLCLAVLAALTGCNHHNGPAGSFAPDEITLRTVTLDGKGFMELGDQPLTFEDTHGVQWIAPKGTLSDGASVPRLALWITDGRFDREFLKAAIVHDAYCQKENKDRCPDQYQKKPWRDVHRMFYDGSRAGGTSPSKAGIMFAAVWIGGPRWDDPASDLQLVSDEFLRIGFDSCEQWIQDNNPTAREIEVYLDQREPTLVGVSKFQSRGIAALGNNDLAAADGAFRQAENLMSKSLEKHPNDLMLLNLKGHHFKNRAIKYRQLEMRNRELREINKAEQTFQEIMSLVPQDPSALNGMSSVRILQNDLDRAGDSVRKALEIAPNHPAAKFNKNLIERLRVAPPSN